MRIYVEHAKSKEQAGIRDLLNYALESGDNIFQKPAKKLLDIGCSYSGSLFVKEYKKLFPQTSTFHLDEKLIPLQFEHDSDNKICADARRLSIRDASVDMINASYFPGVSRSTGRDYSKIFDEIYRILIPDGLFFFNYDCGDSFEDLRDAIYKSGFSYLRHLARIDCNTDPIDMFVAIKGVAECSVNSMLKNHKTKL